MEYRILGPLEVLDNGRPLSLGGNRQRALLALLLLNPNEVVSTDRLLDELWGEQPPESRSKAVQVLVSQLRKALQADGVLETRAPGYVLHVGPGELDRQRFEALVDKAAAEQDAEVRAATLRDALALWRGPALADLFYEAFAQPAITRLTEARLAALEDRIDADLSVGRQSALVGELEELVGRHPLRERLRGQLMLALYRSGRQADALAAFQKARRTLVDELGVEPSPELRTLHKQILEQDPALGAPRKEHSAPEPASRRRRPRLLFLGGAAAVAVVAAILATVVLVLGGGAETVVVTPNSVAVIEPENGTVVDTVPVGDSPGPIAASDDSLWVVNLNDRTLMKIDSAARSVVGSVAVPVATGRDTPPLQLAVAGEDVWVWSCHLSLYRVDPLGVRIVQQLEIFRDVGAFTGFSCAVAAEPGAVWVPIDYPQGVIVRVESPPDTPASISDRFPVAVSTSRTAMTLGAESLWLADHEGGAVRRLDPKTGAIDATMRLGDGPTAMAYGAGAIWVANDVDDSVTRIDLRTNSVVRAISVGTDPAALAVGENSVWVANSGDGTVSRIDPATNEVKETIEVGHRPLGVAVADSLVWVTVRS